MRISDWSSDVCSSDLFHTRFAQLRVGVCVTVVADDHARLERDNVVAVIPLLAFGDVGVASGLHHAQLVKGECLCDDGGQMTFLLPHVDLPLLFTRTQRDRKSTRLNSSH